MKHTTPHIVTAYEEAIRKLRSSVVEMAGAAETQLDGALSCLTHRDPELAGEVIRGDHRLDREEQGIEAHAMRLLVLRQPVADDLREVMAALKIAHNLERVGDYAANIAKRSAALVSLPDLGVGELGVAAALPELGRMVRERLSAVVDAYVEADAEAALDVWRRDAEVDALYTSLCGDIVRAAGENADLFATHMHLLFMAKNLERIGDHATNIAEVVHFLATGRPLAEERPKADRTSETATI
ncbi:phosphate signaling complex protein PhoU [Azospirillum sp.]|uniref:phosphate signaling complex protein PhoU n=1 Tax=Azospirillum sp. TaxID=34012 RepID=UPI002D543D2B|nr:phosphate signaling complex protein PhoU [Azospirillum sp.]HYD66778.1 phosphate signaling complex protein PhoU [Azospirillum sp.]